MPDEFERIMALIGGGHATAAQDALRSCAAEPWTRVLRLRLALQQGGMSVETAMQRLVILMREQPDLRGARELYEEMSSEAYREHVSSPSHSHLHLPAVRLDVAKK